eukprot:572287-Prymnesium_polylepis.1
MPADSELDDYGTAAAVQARGSTRLDRHGRLMFIAALLLIATESARLHERVVARRDHAALERLRTERPPPPSPPPPPPPSPSPPTEVSLLLEQLKQAAIEDGA